MKTTMVRYKVKADRAAENERYIAAVFEQLGRDRRLGSVTPPSSWTMG